MGRPGLAPIFYVSTVFFFHCSPFPCRVIYSLRVLEIISIACKVIVISRKTIWLSQMQDQNIFSSINEKCSHNKESIDSDSNTLSAFERENLGFIYHPSSASSRNFCASSSVISSSSVSVPADFLRASSN